MPWARQTPILLPYCPGTLCRRPYPGHARGCPNYGARLTCPPKAQLWRRRFRPSDVSIVVWNVFAFGKHVERMRERHPSWTQRQLACCLYWQGTARKQLRAEIAHFRRVNPERWIEVYPPEALGVDVTSTMALLGHRLEWPPVEKAYQVAIMAKKER